MIWFRPPPVKTLNPVYCFFLTSVSDTGIAPCSDIFMIYELVGLENYFLRAQIGHDRSGAFYHGQYFGVYIQFRLKGLFIRR
jgi:hypothetical protein